MAEAQRRVAQLAAVSLARIETVASYAVMRSSLLRVMAEERRMDRRDVAGAAVDDPMHFRASRAWVDSVKIGSSRASTWMLVVRVRRSSAITAEVLLTMAHYGARSFNASAIRREAERYRSSVQHWEGDLRIGQQQAV